MGCIIENPKKCKENILVEVGYLGNGDNCVRGARQAYSQLVYTKC